MVTGKDTIPAATEDIPAILKSYHTIAVVGLSPEPDRASHQVAAYLQSHGYRIIPVNPQCREVLGQTCYASLKDIPEPVEVVDIFRKAEAIPGSCGGGYGGGSQSHLDAARSGICRSGSQSPGRRTAGGHEPVYED